MVYQSQEDSGLCPTLFYIDKYRAQRAIESPNKFWAMILDELLAIPVDATNATVQGVEMKLISNAQAEILINNDAEDEKTHECILKNGRFLFESENGELKALYKVQK